MKIEKLNNKTHFVPKVSSSIVSIFTSQHIFYSIPSSNHSLRLKTLATPKMLYIKYFLFLVILLLLAVSKCFSSSTRSNYHPPCKSFFLDIPSAFRYHLCRRLLRGRVYEGIGGKKVSLYTYILHEMPCLF